MAAEVQIDDKLLSILRCPVTKAPLVLWDGWLYAADHEAPRRYPIRDGIPVLIADEAEAITREVMEDVLSRAGRR